VPAREWRIDEVTDETPDLVEAVRELFTEYHGWLGEVVCSQRLAEEIAALPGVYAPPAGRLLLARAADGTPAGVVGIRPFEADVCEMKRLYVQPGARGAGLGRLLAERAIAAARELGYAEIRLTTLPGAMDPALAMYRRMGFVETEAFTDHSHVERGVDITFMRLPLSSYRR